MAALATIQETAFVVIDLFCLSFECVQRNMEFLKYRALSHTLSLDFLSILIVGLFVFLSLSADFWHFVKWMGIRAGQTFGTILQYNALPNMS